MKVGDLVMHKVVHENQEEPYPLIIIKIAAAPGRPPALCVEVMDLERGTCATCFSWQLEVIDESR